MLHLRRLQKQFDKHLKKLQAVLQKVRNVLEDMDARKKDDKLFAQHLINKITINDILIHADIFRSFLYGSVNQNCKLKQIVEVKSIMHL